MTVRSVSGLSRLLAPALAASALTLLLACSSNESVTSPPPFAGGSSGPLDIDCLLDSPNVLTGSTPSSVFARVTRGNVPLSGATVTFLATRGLVLPADVVTDSQGMATAQFTPPGTAGDARIDMSVTDRSIGDTAATSCTVGVTTPRNPRLNVHLLVPDQAAGLEVRVLYDPARVDLPAGGARAAGPYASPGCIALANDNGFGVVDLDIACSTLQAPTSTIATFDFLHLAGPEIRASDFAVTCVAFDIQGRAVAAACTTTVSLL